MRLSAGRGHFAPLPFTDDTEAIGPTSVAPLGPLEPEHANTLSGDLTWTHASFEVTGTLFHSRVDNALAFREDPGSFAGRIVNASQPTRTRGTEFIARHHEDNLDVIVTHMYLWSTEEDEAGGIREVPLNPRHSGSFDLGIAIWLLEGASSDARALREPQGSTETAAQPVGPGQRQAAEERV